MCSISVLFNKNPCENSDFFLKKRGPDLQSNLYINGFFISHHLLHLTGELTKQPVFDNDIYCVFNGEIYNYKDFGNLKSDAYAIIESYKKYGDSFVTKLDGEFAIFLIDFKNNFIFISSDVFGTKPIYYSLDGGFGVSSYKSFLNLNGYKNIIRVEPNTTIKLDFNFNIIKNIDVYSFNLDQYKNDFNDWNNAIINSVNKRFNSVNYDIILPLSSGNDSGLIACVLNMLNIDYISYSYLRNEDVSVINKRLELNKNSVKLINSNPINVDDIKNKISINCEVFYYGYDYNDTDYFGFNDPGALGLYKLLYDCKNEYKNLKILASGQGSDEIMSNFQAYKFRNPNPEFFTEDLKSVFPWDNFYKGAQSSYLLKEECVTGSLGIEGRYPFLDKKLVQEFLNLKPDLKNSHFKSPTTNFLLQNNYPINYIKKGFNPS